MFSRSKKILSLLPQADKKILDILSIPNYESSNGTSIFEQSEAIKRKNLLFDEEVPVLEVHLQNMIDEEDVYPSPVEDCNYDSDEDPEFIPNSKEDTSSEEEESITANVSTIPKNTESGNSKYNIALPSTSADSLERIISTDRSSDDERQIISKPPKKTKCVRTKDYCLYCESMVLNFARHIFRNHSTEIEVQQICSKPCKSKERKELITVLRKKGNYILNASEGCKKPVKRPYISDTTHIPCIYCLGFYAKKQLWRHRKKCEKNPNIPKSSLGLAQNLLLTNTRIDEHLKTAVFPHMRVDLTSLVAKKDTLICAFGARYLKTHRKKHFIPVTSRKMRELAKLLIEAQKIEPNVKNLFDVLKPQHYDLLVQSTKNVARYDADTETYTAPTYAMNICKSLKDCCDIAITYALKRKGVFATIPSAEAQSDLKTMILLLQTNWQFDISSQAASDLNIKKWNKVTIIPLASDIKLFKEYLSNMGTVAAAKLKQDNYDKESYKALVESIFCRVLLLNRKRPGELERMSVHSYSNSDAQSNYEEFNDVISPTEKILMQKFKRVVIRGKRGRGVPVLFSHDVQEHISLLLTVRQNFVDINKNIYLFGKLGKTGPIRGYMVLQKLANGSKIKNPAAITATRLRKHLATITQIFNMSEGDIEQLATFMGHSDRVHRGEYRLPDDVYQTAKICKLLIMMESGTAVDFKGKSLQEIEFNMEDDLLQASEGDMEEDLDDINTSILSEISVSEPNPVKIIGKKRKLVPWTIHQKKVVNGYFKSHITNKHAPKRKECEKLIEMYPDLFNNKPWLKIKVFVQNQYRKLNNKK